MSVKIKTVDGKRQISVKFSKMLTVKDLKHEVEKQLQVKKDLQQLFFSGKQLENGYYLDDYNITYNNIILLMVKTQDEVENKITSGNKESTEKKEANRKEKEEKAESLYYKIEDAVDCKDEETGAWFEAIIKYIYKKGDEVFYEILWEFTNAISSVPEAHIRPRARRSILFDELSVNQKVMINYNVDDPVKIGLWFDFTISKMQTKGKRQELVGQLHVNGELNIRKRVKRGINEKIYAIETSKLLTERTAEDERFMISNGKARPMAPTCEKCRDNPETKCRSCGCKICAGKKETDTLLICDECNDMFHIKCLTPPLLEVPQETYWYCPECKNDENEIVKAGGKLKQTKKKRLCDNKERNWGGGMACARRQNVRYMVPCNHCGPIPGVDVGTTWKFRIQVSEAEVHRPLVHGIHGRENDCGYSIVLSGGYEGDYDNGDEFLYSGSGGRDFSGNKRTNIQSKDQTLTRMNLALAKNCNAPVNNKIGATASDWKKGKPVRVVRNYKLASKYAPKEGNRYDGTYKVVRYYPDTSVYGFLMWKFVLRRDDPTPAPWTEEGKERIAFLGLKMLYPDGYPMETFNKKKAKKRLAIDENMFIKKPKIMICAFDLEEKLKILIENDKVNAKLWDECKATLIDGKPAFLDCVSERFKCVCCLAILYEPVTTPCGHNICLSCLKRSFASEIYSCSTCRYSLGKTYNMKINQTLSSALLLIYPGYKGEQ